MTRGFVTVATGSKEYYSLAQNLLKSYICFTNNPMGFSVITDNGNNRIKGFDKVIILEKTYGNTLDKLEILDKSPYDETIFIDADCLAYDDLNKLWSYFEGCDDVSTLGDLICLSEEGWYAKEDVGEFADKIDYSVRLHGGIYFVRKGQTALRTKELCDYIINTFDNYHFHVWPDYPVDETVISLAMAVLRLTPIPQSLEIIDVFFCNTSYDIDISKRKVIYQVPWGSAEHALLVHFGTANTRKWFYNVELYKMNKIIRNAIIFPWTISFVKCIWINKEKHQLRCEKLRYRIWKIKVGIRRIFPKKVV